MSAPVAVTIVTWNAARDLTPCLEAVAALEPRPREIVVVDSGSTDGTAELLDGLTAPPGMELATVALADNRGFAGGMNVAVAASRAPWVLSLNADARPEPDAVTRLLELARSAEEAGLRVGAVTGRLVRPVPSGDDGPRLLDACGMRLTPTWRHLDRGSDEPDRGQYAQPERVFGGTGAATLFSRAALDDVAIPGALAEGADQPPWIFDPWFHSFREDAELAFRLRERGWEVLYQPTAQIEHRRFNLPRRRSEMPPAVNYHSLKNRYLLRAVHQTPGNFLRTAPWTLVRDAMALGYVLVKERTSLAAYAWLWRHRRDILSRRRAVQARRTEPADHLDRWFHTEGLPLP